MEIGFLKDGLTLNSKKLNTLNIPVKGVKLESDIPVEHPNPADILSVFQRPNIRNANRLEEIEILKSMIEKAR